MRKTLISLFTFVLLIAAAVSAGARNKYLFVYFTGNAPEQEQITYAVSDDGFNYTPLNGGRPVVASDTIARTGCVRDPHILRAPSGEYLMVATDMRSSLGWSSNRGLVLMKSRDLVHWEHHAVHFPERYAGTNLANVTRVWAPQTIYDEKAGKFMVYFSLLTNDGTIPYDRVYWAYANDDFSDLATTPQVLFDFHAPGSWTLLDGFCEQTKENVEGAGVFPLVGGGWCLMYDCYMSGHYQFTRSDDLRSFRWVADTKTTGAFTPRHGTVIQITPREYKRLVKALCK